MSDLEPVALPREQWATRLGFILATLGSAIGLGNIWRFAYVAGDNGGGAFLVIYLAAVLIIGMPLLLAELALGRHAQGDVVLAYERAAQKSPLRFVGLVVVFGAGLILSYYAVVAGWTLRYLFKYGLGFLGGLPDEDHGTRFARFIAAPLEPLAWHGAFLALTVAVVLGGIRRGIEAANRVLLPLLGVTVIALAAYSLSLPGAGDGVRFLLQPEWTALAEPQVYLAALGQAFFSLGLAMGVLATYGGYLGREHRLATAAVAITFGDVLFALVAGLAIFPAVFAFGLAPAQGPILAFVVLPEVFGTMAGGTLFGFAFFFLLVAAALTSAVSLLEVPVAYAIRRFALARWQATVAIGLAIFLAGVPSSLGYGLWSDVVILQRPILDAIDYLASNFMLPIAGIAVAMVVGWLWPARGALNEADLTDGAAGRLWLAVLRVVAPLVIALILLRSIGFI